MKYSQPSVIIILTVLIFSAVTLSSCSPGSSANEYNLTKTINEGKFPKSEMDNVAYAVREAIEANYRWDTEWLTYWANAEMVGRCGTIKVNDSQEGKTEVPLKPVDLKELVSIETWIEYQSYTESQLINSQNEAPIKKIAKSTVVYKENRWEIKSVAEMTEDLGAYCP